MTFAALLAAAACSSAPGMEPRGEAADDASTPVASPPASPSFAQRTAAANVAAEKALHLVARGSTADGGNLLEFYEPSPGRILISIASDPAHSAPLQPDSLRGKSVLQMWQTVAPNEAVPKPLLAALRRGNRDEHVVLLQPIRKKSTRKKRRAPKPVSADVVSAGPPQESADKLVAGDTGYCAGSQFTSDYASWFSGAYQAYVDKHILGTGGYEISCTATYNDYLVCPGGAGGSLEIFYEPPGSSTFPTVFAVGHDEVRWVTTPYTVSCGWNLFYGCGSEDRCSYGTASTEGLFYPSGTGGYWLLARFDDPPNWCTAFPGEAGGSDGCLGTGRQPTCSDDESGSGGGGGLGDDDDDDDDDDGD